MPGFCSGKELVNSWLDFRCTAHNRYVLSAFEAFPELEYFFLLNNPASFEIYIAEETNTFPITAALRTGIRSSIIWVLRTVAVLFAGLSFPQSVP